VIDRRAALARMVAMTGATVIGAEFFLSGCARSDKRRAVPFTADDVALLDEIGETIIPATDTPGAKAANIGAFMSMMVTDCYDDDNHRIFHDGLSAVDRACRKAHGKPFLDATPAERTSLLNTIDAEQRKYMREKARTEPPHYFRLMKDLTVLGFFSSEVGCTSALRYVEAPGAYNGDLAYKRGDRGFFNPTRRIG
jgi:hypothetical protein